MKQPDAKEWGERLRKDSQWLRSNIHPRMYRALRLLDPQTTFDKKDNRRNKAPWARRVVKGLGSLDFLHRLPHLDAEYLGSGGEKADESNSIEDVIGLIGDRTQMVRRLKEAHHTNFWSPVAFLKQGMTALGVLQSNSINEATPDLYETVDYMEQDFEQVSEEMVRQLGLNAQSIPPLEQGATNDSINEQPILPEPKTSLDIPWVDWVDPRHIIMERGIRTKEFARYIGHVIIMPAAKFHAGDYINKDKVQEYYANSYGEQSKTTDPGTAQGYFGKNMMGTFDVPSSAAVVVLVEIWIREDPDHPEITQRVGVLEMLSDVWVSEPRANPLKIFPWTMILASDETPGIWTGPSYIEQSWDDIEDAAWNRDWLRSHMQSFHNIKWFLPNDLMLDETNMAKMKDPEYRGPIWYDGNRPPPDPQQPPVLPVSVSQHASFINQEFMRNSGITGTQQGAGSSNKVATAFRQEERFSNERRDDIRFKVYSLYRETMLNCTFLMQRYLVSPVELRRKNGVKFQFSRDSLKGIIGYRMEVVDVMTGDPMQERMVELQTLQRVLSIPELAAQFDKRELARIVARLNGWGSRALAEEQPPATQAPADVAGQGQPTAQQDGRSLGSRVDSAQETGDTSNALAGASLRGGGQG